VVSDYLWCDEETAELVRLWSDGVLSAREIGKRLGRNKNEVLGKRRRLGLPERVQAHFSAKRQAKLVELRPKVEQLLNEGVNARDVAYRLHISDDFTRAVRNEIGIKPQRGGWPHRTAPIKPKSRERVMESSYNRYIPAQKFREAKAPSAADIDAWIAENGVKKLPIAACSVTTATIPDADRAALQEYRSRKEKEWSAKYQQRVDTNSIAWKQAAGMAQRAKV
jgi:hypothetical protein